MGIRNHSSATTPLREHKMVRVLIAAIVARSSNAFLQSATRRRRFAMCDDIADNPKKLAICNEMVRLKTPMPCVKQTLDAEDANRAYGPLVLTSMLLTLSCAFVERRHRACSSRTRAKGARQCSRLLASKSHWGSSGSGSGPGAHPAATMICALTKVFPSSPLSFFCLRCAGSISE